MTGIEGIGRAIAFRKPNGRYRFLFAQDATVGLMLEEPGVPLSGGTRLPALAPSLPGAITGAMLVDDAQAVTFCVTADPSAFLAGLIAWCRQTVAAIPALAGLQDATAAQLDFDWTADAAIAGIDPRMLTQVQDRRGWRGLVTASAGHLGRTLARALPGERLWFWLAGSDTIAAPPLILQSIAEDPARDCTNRLIRDAAGDGAPAASSGIAMLLDDGRLQLTGADLTADDLTALAEWVHETVAEAPSLARDLARLARCRLVRSAGGLVEDVFEDETLWAGLDRPPATATTAETIAILQALRPGDAFWFWMTGTAPDGGFLTLAPVRDDPAGTGFGQRVPGLFRRFARSHEDAVSGLLRVAGPGTAVLVSATAETAGWPALMQAVIAGLGPAAGALAGAVLIDPTGHRIPQPPQPGPADV